MFDKFFCKANVIFILVVASVKINLKIKEVAISSEAKKQCIKIKITAIFA
jgi:hypothetical protein